MQKAKSPKRGPGKAANRKAVLSAQQTIPYLVMHPDGVCQLPGGLYTKTVEYEDINYSCLLYTSQVGTTPAAWNAGVFSLIRQLSETVILPIAGLVLTFVATYELIQMRLEKNNMHELDVANIYKWMFKTACAILILSNTFDIVMAVFDVSQTVIAQAGGLIQGSTDITPDMITELETTLEGMDLGPVSYTHLTGIVGAVGFRLLIYFKSKNAKKFRRDEEYGSARWGTEKDIKPFVDPKFEDVYKRQVSYSG